MAHKKVVILVILGIAAVFSLIYGIFTPAKGHGRASVSSRPEAAAQRSGAKPADKAGIKHRAKKTTYTSWARDLFALPEASKSAMLKGIFWDGSRPAALISDEVVEIGGKVGIYTVVDIRQDGVILNDGTKDFEIKLPE